MAADKIEIELIVDDKGTVAVKRFLRSTEREAKRTSESVKRSFREGFTGWIRVADSGIRGLIQRFTSLKSLMVAGAAGYGATSLARSFLQAARTTENFAIRLQVLLGSVEEGNRLFQAMADYASRVPFQYEEIMSSATALAGVMKGGVEEIKRWMPMIGDLAAVSGLTIEETTSQIIRMYSAGAAAADMFRERGILAMLGFQAGVSYTAEETRKKLIEAWESPTSRFRGAADRLGKTWDGLMSMMADKWFQLRNKIMAAGVFDELKKQLELLNQEFGRWIENNRGLIRQKVPEYLNKIGGSLKTIADMLGKIAKYAGLKSILGTFKEGAELASKGLIDWKEFVKADFFRRQKMVEQARQTYGATGPLHFEIQDTRLSDALKSIKDKVKTEEEEISRIRRQLLDEESQHIKEQVAFIASSLKEEEKNYQDFTEKVKQYQQEAIVSLGETQYNAAKALEEALQDPDKFFGPLKKDSKEATEEISSTVSEEYKRMLERIHDATADTFYDIFSGTLKGWKDLFDRIKDYFIRLLAELAAQAVARPIILPIVASVAGGVGLQGIANAAAGGSGGLGFGGIPGSGLVKYIPGVSGFLSTPIAGTLTGGSVYSATYSGWASALNPAATWGGALGAAGLGSLGYSTIGKWLGLPQSKYSGITSGLGAGVGFAFGGPLGAGIGALAGGLLGGLFGGHKKPPRLEYGFTMFQGGKRESPFGKYAIGFGRGVTKEFKEQWIRSINDTNKLIAEQLTSTQIEAVKESLQGWRYYGVIHTKHAPSEKWIKNTIIKGTKEYYSKIFGAINESLGEFIKIADADTLQRAVNDAIVILDKAKQYPEIWKSIAYFTSQAKVSVQEAENRLNEFFQILSTRRQTRASLSQSFSEFLNRVKFSDLAPVQSWAAYEQQFERMKAVALTDPNAFKDYTQFAEQYLRAGKTYFGLEEDYKTFYSRIISAVEKTAQQTPDVYAGLLSALGTEGDIYKVLTDIREAIERRRDEPVKIEVTGGNPLLAQMSEIITNTPELARAIQVVV